MSARRSRSHAGGSLAVLAAVPSVPWFKTRSQGALGRPFSPLVFAMRQRPMNNGVGGQLVLLQGSSSTERTMKAQFPRHPPQPFPSLTQSPGPPTGLGSPLVLLRAGLGGLPPPKPTPSGVA